MDDLYNKMHAVTELAKDRTFKVRTYSFMELSKTAKDHAVEKLQDINVEDIPWDESVLDGWKAKLEDVGFSNPEVAYSGFGSQGDGASFTSKSVDVEKLAKVKEIKPLLAKIPKDEWENLHISVDRISSQHYHYNTINVAVYYDGEAKVDKELNALEKALDDFVKGLSKQIYKDLEHEYMYQISEKSIIDTIKANDYEFTENGELFSGVRGGSEVESKVQEKVAINTMPSKEDLELLIADAKECLANMDSGMLLDHLENSIAKVLGQPVPHPDLEEKHRHAREGAEVIAGSYGSVGGSATPGHQA